MDYNEDKKLKKIIIHPWSGTRIYGVRHVRKIVVNKFPRKIESEFLIEIKCKEQEGENTLWEINKTSPTINETNENDKSLALLKSLEDFTYPITVETDSSGNFISLKDHKEWTEEWRTKAKNLAIEEYDVNGNLDLFQKFYEIILDEEKFLDNKNREGFWRLLFLNFKIAIPLDPNYSHKQSFHWNLMHLGSKHIKGKSAGYLLGNDFILSFKSKDFVDKEIVAKAIKVYGLKQPYDIFSPTIDFEINAKIEDQSRKLLSKTAFLELSIEEQFNYKEEISIIFINEIA